MGAVIAYVVLLALAAIGTARAVRNANRKFTQIINEELDR